MTQPKKISETIRNLLTNQTVKIILDRSSDLWESGVINTVQNYWGYDLLSRRPSPAYDDYGLFKGTNLDLACFLYSLSGRGAVINIPVYKPLRQSKIKEGEKVISKYDRNGKLIGVKANKDFFIFSISMIDQNVIGEDKVGEFRNFSITDFDGNFYPGWSSIQFVPTLNENKFITENKLWSGNKIVFKNFIHPNRWVSFFGQHYIITKMLINRLEEEASYYSQQCKSMIKDGITYPKGEGPKEYISEASSGKKSLAFESFQADIYIPDASYINEYKLPEKPNQATLVDFYNRRKNIVYTIIPTLRFMTRATEFAHYKAPELFPAWIQNTNWENDFTLPGKRIKWERLKLFQTKPGEFSVSILRRTLMKKTMVHEDY